MEYYRSPDPQISDVRSSTALRVEMVKGKQVELN